MDLLNIYISKAPNPEPISGETVTVKLGGTIDVSCQNDKGHYTLAITELSYDKKMFSPCEMDIKFSVTKPAETVSPLPKVLKEEFIDTECVVNVFSGTDSYLLKNCYVYSAGCSSPDSSSLTCSLKCYSADHKMTLIRSCEVFAGKKFGESVFKAHIPEGIEYEFSLKRLLLMGYDSASQTRKLTLNDAKTQLLSRDAELIHPYLVRYNESLYSFLARVAHRCGEFLCFENGKLCLGLPEETLVHIAQEKYDSVSGISCSYEDIGEIKPDSDDFSLNYVEGDSQVKADGCVYDAQQASDEFLHLVNSDDDMKNYAGWWIGVRALSALFTSKDFLHGLCSAGYSVLDDVLTSCVALPSRLHGIFNSEYVDVGSREASALSDNLRDNLSSHFYHVIEKLEDESARGKVILDFSDKVPELILGDDMALDDGVYDNYIVSRMYGRFSCLNGALSGQHNVEGVPVMPTDQISGLEYVAVPPSGDVSHFLNSEPMEAIVIRNDDPLRLNRVKVRYPWQMETDDFKKLSPWIRVAVPFAGSEESSGGFAMTPGVGEHVVLKYLDGNMERPYVKGSVYFKYVTADNKVVSHRPALGRNGNMQHRFFIPSFDTRTIASTNGHSLMFKDLEDTSLLSDVFPLLGTIYNITQVEEYESTKLRQPIPYGTIKGGGINLSDASGVCQLDLSPDTRSVLVSSPYGTVNISAFTGMTVNAPNGDIKIKGKNVHIEAGNNLSLRAGTNITRKKVSKSDIAGFLSGSALSTIGADLSRRLTGVDLKGSLDLSFIRCITEMILRPVEGTLSLHSNRNTVIIAGKGKVTVPRNLLSKTSTSFHNTPFSAFGPVKTQGDVNYLISSYLSCVDCTFTTAREAYSKIVDMAGDIQKIQNERLIWAGNFDFTQGDAGLDKMIKAAWAGTYCRYKEDAVSAYLDDHENVVLFDKFQSVYNRFVDKVLEYKKQIFSFGLLENHFKQLNNSGMKVSTNDFPKGYGHPFDVEEKNAPLYDPRDDANRADIEKRKKVMKRSVVCQILIGCDILRISRLSLKQQRLGNGQEKKADSYVDDIRQMEGYVTGVDVYKWEHMKNALVPYKKPSPKPTSGAAHFFSALLAGVTGKMGGGFSYNLAQRKLSAFPQLRKLVNWNGESGPRAYSEISSRGNVMMSDTDLSMKQLNRSSTKWDTIDNESSHKPTTITDAKGFGDWGKVDDANQVSCSFPLIWDKIKDL